MWSGIENKSTSCSVKTTGSSSSGGGRGGSVVWLPALRFAGLRFSVLRSSFVSYSISILYNLYIIY